MKPEVLLADASVLIDYIDTNGEILGLVASHFADLRVPRSILEEVPRLTLKRCRELHISVVDAETEVLVEAGQRSDALGFNDTLCLVLCERNCWTCVTNDGALRNACMRSGVPVRRGLSLMIELVRLGHLTRDAATSTANAIGSSNRFITTKVLAEFEALLNALP